MPLSRTRPPAKLSPPPRSGPSPGPRPGPRPAQSPKARLLRRVLIALMAGLGLVVLERTGVLDKATGTSLFGPRIDWSSDYALVEYLRGVVVDRGLTRDAKDCLLFVVNGNDPPNAVRMKVMEKHSGACPGDKTTLPLLFTLKVDRLGQTVQTDSGSPGLFHPLP